MQLIDQMYYDQEKVYFSEVYNKKGLTEWEQEMVNKFFDDCKRLIVAGAGGGREVYALRRAGYLADGFECNLRLLEHAKGFLGREGVSAGMYWAPRDECPSIEEKYDGIIVGWGTYTHIQGQNKRVAFLRSLKAMARGNASVLLSFVHRPERQNRIRVTTSTANFIRKLLLRDPIEPGDYLAPTYIHYFSKEQIERELLDAGFQLRFYSTDPYGHAVGVSLP